MVVDPCEGVTCEEGEVCEDGVCVPEPLVGDPVNGQAVYDARGCVACHGTDGSNGIFQDIKGSSQALLDATLRDPDSTHTGGTQLDLTDQEIADLEAFLAL